MIVWPNWVDLIVVTIFLRASYSGFGRGFLAEMLNLIGAVSATALTINYANMAIQWLQPWFWFDATVAAFIVFGVLFLSCIFVVHMMIRRITEVLKWERLHWAVQGLGLILGGLRGLWWAGMVLIILASSGFEYLRQSVETNSVLGPRLVTMSREGITRVTDRFPGVEHRGRNLTPPLRAGAR